MYLGPRAAVLLLHERSDWTDLRWFRDRVDWQVGGVAGGELALAPGMALGAALRVALTGLDTSRPTESSPKTGASGCWAGT